MEVELGDAAAVRRLMNKGADPGAPYKMDGVMTTPIRSALSRGDFITAKVLLCSSAVKPTVEDLRSAPIVEQGAISPELARQLAIAIGAEERTILLELRTRGVLRVVGVARQGKNQTVALESVVAEQLRPSKPQPQPQWEQSSSEGSSETGDNAPETRPRCPPELAQQEGSQASDSESPPVSEDDTSSTSSSTSTDTSTDTSSENDD